MMVGASGAVNPGLSENAYRVRFREGRSPRPDATDGKNTTKKVSTGPGMHVKKTPVTASLGGPSKTKGRQAMMRKLGATLAILLASAVMASAGGGFALYGTYMDMADFDDAGYGGGLKLQADLSGDDVVGFEFRLGGVTGYGGDAPETEDSYLVTLEANLTLGVPVGENLKAYVGAGGGYYVFGEYESKEPIAGFDSHNPDMDPEDVFGFFGVAGIEIRASEALGIFVEAKYLVAEIEEIDIDDETMDIDEGDFGGLGVNAGLIFRF